MEENKIIEDETKQREADPEKPENAGKTQPLKKKSGSFFIFLLVLSIWVIAIQYMSADKYDAMVKVVGENGQANINAAADNLDYGNLSRESSSARFITIENNGDSDIYIRILKTGNIGRFIKMNENEFILGPHKKEKVEFFLEVPKSAKEKDYKGKIIIFKIPKVL